MEIKKCPFCGGKAALIYVDDRTWQVVCDDCGACSDYYDEEWDPDNPLKGKVAIEAWNHRSIDNDLQAELNKARLALAQIYEIVDGQYNWEYDYGIGEIYGTDLEALAHIIKEYGM